MRTSTRYVKVGYWRMSWDKTSPPMYPVTPVLFGSSALARDDVAPLHVEKQLT